MPQAVYKDQRPEDLRAGYDPASQLIKTPWYCRECGKQDLWQHTDAGDDYYHQYSATCHSCDAETCCVGKIIVNDDGSIEVD